MKEVDEFVLIKNYILFDIVLKSSVISGMFYCYFILQKVIKSYICQKRF